MKLFPIPLKTSIRRSFFRILLPVLLIFILIPGCFAGCQTLRFYRFTNTLFRSELESDTLSMHYILAYPEKYGIADDQAVLPIYSDDAREESRLQLAKYLRTAKSLRPALLGKESRQLLSLLTEYLNAEQQTFDFPFYAEPLSPGSGIQSSLPILLAEYTFRTRQDVDNYLALLSQIPDWLESIAAYEQKKADAGLFMSDAAADRVIQQCYEIMEQDKLAADTHFLNTTFAARLQELTQKQLLSPGEEAVYLQQNHSLLLECVMPAYETLGDQILLLKGSGVNAKGLAHFPDGKEYYRLLLAQTTGCDRPIPESKQLLTAKLQKDTEALSRILKEHPGLFSLSPDSAFPTTDAEDCLLDLQQRISKDFPAMPKTGDAPRCTVKQVSKSLEDFCAPAFYLTPPIDDISENSIYINTKDAPGPLSLYTTLAHEGYPGHLYQTVYYQLYQQSSHTNPARNLLHYGGYTEGWALYVEMLSYDYAKEVLQEQGASSDSLLLVDAMRLSRSIQLCLYSLLDLEIHYEGASPEKASVLLNRFGITEPTLCEAIYEYIVQEPANYPKYYMGYLEFEMLKTAAQEKWGNEYSDMRFHKMVLETGPCPFSLLWDRL